MDNKQIVWWITRIVSGVIISIIALGAFTDSIVGGVIGLIGAALTFLPLNKKITAFKGRQIVFIALPAVCLTVACILSPIASDPADKPTTSVNTTEKQETVVTTEKNSEVATTEKYSEASTTEKSSDASTTENTVEESTTKKNPEASTTKNDSEVSTAKATDDATNTEISKKIINKVAKYIKKKKFDSLAGYSEKLNINEKNYVAEQLENYYCSLLTTESDFYYNARDIKNLIEKFSAIKVSTANSKKLYQALLLEYNCDKKVPAVLDEQYVYIENVDKAEYITFYVDSRVHNTSEEGEFLNYYVCYTNWKNSNGKTYPDYDSPIIIVYSDTPLDEGLMNLRLVPNGTYKTQSRLTGIESEDPLYMYHPDEEWARYENREKNLKIRNTVIDVITRYYSAGNYNKGKSKLNPLISQYIDCNFSGEWLAGNKTVYENCFVNINCSSGKTTVRIETWGRDGAYGEYTMSCTYDLKSDMLVYSNGKYTSGSSGSFKNSKGSFRWNDYCLDWEDSKTPDDIYGLTRSLSDDYI